MNLFDMTILSKSKVVETSTLATAISARSNIVEMVQSAEDAVLRPNDFGAFDHDLRSAVAARIAASAGDKPLAEYFSEGAGKYAILVDPNETGQAQGLDVILAFADRVANQTAKVSAKDVSDLQASGVSDKDIVKLCELVAFLAFQLRVISGLRLMQEDAA